MGPRRKHEWAGHEGKGAPVCRVGLYTPCAMPLWAFMLWCTCTLHIHALVQSRCALMVWYNSAVCIHALITVPPARAA